MTDGLRFVGATPVWWQSRCEVSVCIALGEAAAPALVTLASVGELEGPLAEVLMLAWDRASPAAEAVLDWLLDHLWMPALVLEGGGGAETLRPRARAGRVLTLTAGELVPHDLLLEQQH